MIKSKNLISISSGPVNASNDAKIKAQLMNCTFLYGGYQRDSDYRINGNDLFLNIKLLGSFLHSYRHSGIDSYYRKRK